MIISSYCNMLRLAIILSYLRLPINSVQAIDPITTTECEISKECVWINQKECSGSRNCIPTATHQFNDQTGYILFQLARQLNDAGKNAYIAAGYSSDGSLKNATMTACAIVNGYSHILQWFTPEQSIKAQLLRNMTSDAYKDLEIGVSGDALVCRFKLRIQRHANQQTALRDEHHLFLISGTPDEDVSAANGSVSPSVSKHKLRLLPRQQEVTASKYSTETPALTMSPGFSIITTEYCNVNKSCFYFPSTCTNSSDCRMMVTYAPNSAKDKIHIELGRSLDANSSRQYVAMGLSSKSKMYPASVTACIYNSASRSIGVVLPSHNIDSPNNVFMANDSYPSNLYTNVRIGMMDGALICRFDQLISPSNKYSNLAQLNQAYYLLLTVGLADNDNHLQKHVMNPSSVDYPHISGGRVNFSQPASSPKEGCGVNSIPCSMAPKFYKAHGILMLIGFWILLTNGILFARYFKQCWPDHELFGIKIWFHFHRGLNSVGLMCMLIAIILMLVAQDGRFPKNTPHSYVGWAAIILASIQPVMALFRCHPNDKYRPVFNWCHRLVGVSAWILASANIFLIRAGHGMFTNGGHGPTSNPSTVIMSIYMGGVGVVLILLEAQALIFDQSASRKPGDINRDPGSSHRGKLGRKKDSIRTATMVLFALFAVCTVGSLIFYVVHSIPVI